MSPWKVFFENKRKRKKYRRNCLSCICADCAAQNFWHQGLRQGLRQESCSIFWQSARRGDCCNKLGHGSGRKRGSFVLPHAQKVKVNTPSSWGKGESEEGKQPAAHEKRTCTTRQATQTQPALLAELLALHRTQGGNVSLFDGGKPGGHGRADSRRSAARALSSH